MDRRKRFASHSRQAATTIGEVSELCLVKPYVLRHQERGSVSASERGKSPLLPNTKVPLIRRIRELLYDRRFTISWGA